MGEVVFVMAVFGSKEDARGVVMGNVHAAMESWVPVGTMMIDVAKGKGVVRWLGSFRVRRDDDTGRKKDVLCYGSIPITC